MSTEEELEGRMACNCHYPVLLIGVLLFTIVVLFICVCLCCIDVTSFSEDGGTPAYTMLNNSMSTDSCTCSVPLSRSFHSDASLVSTV
ncbi:hypothetical protein ANCCEY_09184 [Ancylostoma ceylanicum]|uniref:Uncharacterized protein n=1 Tax=Ancylostoma ceylanicum TaxID=53326 RepID=A0A0D6LIA2_9BILA|nr:hypothetical protein ANCCEY_09184 [Ancylostoma ceylanicum]